MTILCPLALVFWAQTALANTETLFVNYKINNAYEQAIDNKPLWPSIPVKNAFTFGAGNDIQEDLYSLQNLSEGAYLIRICWPASRPAEVELWYEPESKTVVARGSSKNVVSLEDQEIAPLRSVPYQLHLEPFSLAFSTRDVIHTSVRTFVLALFTVVFTASLFKELE